MRLSWGRWFQAGGRHVFEGCLCSSTAQGRAVSLANMPCCWGGADDAFSANRSTFSVCSLPAPAARDLLPAEQVRAAACNITSSGAAGAPAVEPAPARQQQQQQQGDDGQPPQRVSPAQLAAACGWDGAAGQLVRSRGNAIDQQHLFSVYVHAPPSITGAGLGRLGVGVCSAPSCCAAQSHET